MSTVTVAARELRDLVDRILRVEGVDPGAAHLVADATVHGESTDHPAAEALLDLVEQHRVDDLLAAVDAIVAAELETRRSGSARVELAAPVADALLLGPLAAAARRGVQRVTSSSAGGRVTALGFALRDSPEPSVVHARHEIVLSRAVFDELTRRAADFLVSEATLDALADDGGDPDDPPRA